MNACDTECNPDVDELPSWSARMAKVFCYVIGQIFALAILALWVTCTLAEPLTLRVVEATPRLNKPNPFIIVRFDGGRLSPNSPPSTWAKILSGWWPEGERGCEYMTQYTAASSVCFWGNWGTMKSSRLQIALQQRGG
jgi:hypothetical protein